MGSVIELVCARCSKKFEKPRNEYTRCVKRKQKWFYCTQSCQVSVGNSISPRGGFEVNLRADNRRDDLTPFRWFVLRARQRKKKGRTDLTAAYLRDVWEEQIGRCAFTGWSLVLPDSTAGWTKDPGARAASLDRVDPLRGYVRGNVRFVAVMANYALARFCDEQLHEFCRAVAANCS